MSNKPQKQLSRYLQKPPNNFPNMAPNIWQTCPRQSTKVPRPPKMQLVSEGRCMHLHWKQRNICEKHVYRLAVSVLPSCFMHVCESRQKNWRWCSGSFSSLASLQFFILFGPRFQNEDLRIRPLGGNFTENLIFKSKAANSGVQRSRIRKIDPRCLEYLYLICWNTFFCWPPKG